MNNRPSYRLSPKTQAELFVWNALIDRYGETAVLAYLDWADVYGWLATPQDFKRRYLGVAWQGAEYILGEDGRYYRFRK